MLDLPREVDVTLAKFIRESTLVDPKDFNYAVSMQSKTGNGIIATLIERGAIDEERLENAIAEKFQLKKTEFNEEDIINRPLKDRVTSIFVRQNRIVTFKETETLIQVMVSDHHGLNNLNKMKSLVGKKAIEVYLCSLSQMQHCIGLTKVAGTGASGNILSPREAFMKALSEEAEGLADEATADGQMKKGSSNVISYVDKLIKNAIRDGISDIHVERYHNDARIRFRKDGVLQEIEKLKQFIYDNYSAVTTRIKILASMDISERRLPQDGGISFFMEKGKTVDLRVSVLPTTDGERIVMRVMSSATLTMGLDELGFSPPNFKLLKKSINAPQGMILVTGPTGSGKSTTLYAVLNALNDDGINILTAEDPVEFNINGIGQVHINDKIGLTFASALRSFLRQDPEIIMVGEIRDKETGDIAVKSSLTGHLVLSTLHTNDAPSTVTRLLNMKIPPYLVTSSLSIVIAQRLGRVNCPHCKIEDPEATPELLHSIGFSKEEANSIKGMIGKGCSKCMDTGIKGRRAIHEVLEMTENLKQGVLKDLSTSELKEIAKEDGYITMQEVARDFVKQGIISVTEYRRILVIT